MKGSGAERGRERKEEEEEDSGYKNSFLGQRDDSAFVRARVGCGAIGSAWLPRVFTYPALIMRPENIELYIGAGIYTLTQDISGRQVFLDAGRRTCYRNNIVRLDIYIRS